MALKLWLLLVLALALPAALSAQVFNCGTGGTAWGTSPCDVATGIPGATGSHFAFFGSASGANVTSGVLTLQLTTTNHDPTNLNWTNGCNSSGGNTCLVNATAFTTHFQFISNSWQTVFVIQNVTRNAGGGAPPGFTLAQGFSGGAGCEAAFYQAFGSAAPANNIFALDFEQNNLLTNTITPFYSNVQIYQQLQSPCIPDDAQPYFYYTNKQSTSPVPMNSPSGTYNTATGDTYDATVIYTGNAVTLNFFDVTTGGTCSPVTSGTCFTYTWPNVSIPTLIDGTTGVVSLGGSTNGSSPYNLTIPAWSFTNLTAAVTPTFSPVAGTYGSTQTVTISDSSSGSTICYNTTGNPMTDGNGNCVNSTKYTGTISVAKGQTLYATAGSGTSSYGDSTAGAAPYIITGYASAPVFNQPGGTWQGNQTVQLTTKAGGVICYSTTTTPATNGTTGCTTGTIYSMPITVSSNETINAIAGGTGFTDSAVSSAAYIISPFAVVGGYTGSFPANSPTFSPVAGTYSGTQSVTIASTTSSSNICYILSPTVPTLMPEPDSLGGCTVGTLYSGAILVASTQTIYAAAGTTVGANVAGTGPPSSVSSAQYTINTGGGPTINGAFKATGTWN